MTETKTLSMSGKEERKLAPPANLKLGRLASPRLFGRRARFLLTALVLVAFSAGAVLWGVNRTHDREVAAGRNAVAFVRHAIPRLLSYNAKTVGSLSSANASLMTRKFGGEYAQLVNTKLAPGVRKESLTNRTDVVTGAVVSATSSRVTLLVFLNQVSRAKGMAAPATTGSRAKVTVVRVGGHWRIDALKPV